MKIRNKEIKFRKKNEEGKEKVVLTPEQKKKRRRNYILGIVAGVLVIFFIMGKFTSAKTGAIVQTQRADKRDLEQILDTSGTVASEESETIYTTVAVPIGEIEVGVGDVVNKGDILFAYNEQEFDNALLLQELQVKADVSGYNAQVQKNNKAAGELGVASKSLTILDQQIKDLKNYINALNTKIEEKQRSLNYHGTMLQVSLLDYAPSDGEYKELQEQIQRNVYEQQNCKEIVDWKKELTTYSDMLNEFEANKSEMKGIKSSNESIALTGEGKAEFESNQQIIQINSKKQLEALQSVKAGVMAPFQGVVTQIMVKEGELLPAGSAVIAIDSTEKVKVEISVTKYDLEKLEINQTASITIVGNTYEGKVSKISQIAEKNANGTPVVKVELEISNPDSNIFLGVEAKVKINIAQKEQVVSIPVEAVNTDKEGDFVYVVENNIVIRREIKTGIASDERIEITEGISEGEQVVTNITANLVEGMAVTAIETDAITQN